MAFENDDDVCLCMTNWHVRRFCSAKSRQIDIHRYVAEWKRKLHRCDCMHTFLADQHDGLHNFFFFFHSVISLRFFAWHGHCLFFLFVSFYHFERTQTCELVFISHLLSSFWIVRRCFFGVQMNILHERSHRCDRLKELSTLLQSSSVKCEHMHHESDLM